MKKLLLFFQFPVDLAAALGKLVKSWIRNCLFFIPPRTAHSALLESNFLEVIARLFFSFLYNC